MKYFVRGRNIVHATNSEYIKGKCNDKKHPKNMQSRVFEKVWGKGGGELNKHKQQILKTFIRAEM